MAGHRVVRVLSSRADRIVCVGRDDGAPAPVERLLKVFPPGAPGMRGEAEASALAAVAHEHVLALVDLSGSPGSELVLVLEHLERGSLEDYLTNRVRIDAGEAVTVLLSVSRGIRALHSGGVAHGRIGTTRIMLDAAGRPILTGLRGAARANAPGGADESAFVNDFVQYAQLARRVLASTEIDGRERECAALLDWLETMSPAELGEDVTEQLEARLVALAPPAPLRRTRSVAASPASPGHRPRREPRSGRRASSLGRFLSHAVLELEVLDRAFTARPCRIARERFAEFAQARRRALILGAAIGALLLFVLLTVLPGGSGGGTRGAPDPRGGTPTGSASAGGSVPSAPGSRATASAGGSATGEQGPTGAEASSSAVASGDDPVTVVPALLEARRRCLGSGSAGCLASSDQLDSPLWGADRERTAGGATSGPSSSASRCADGVPEVCDASLVDRMGDSALIALTPKPAPEGSDASSSGEYAKPASVLVVRTEAGWRLREIFED